MSGDIMHRLGLPRELEKKRSCGRVVGEGKKKSLG